MKNDKVFCTINTERVYSNAYEIAGDRAGDLLPVDTAVRLLGELAVAHQFEGLLEARADLRLVLSGYILPELLEAFITDINRCLKQDCCAVEVLETFETITRLMGPNTEPYGAFDYDYFLHRGATDCPRTTIKLGGTYAD